MKRILVIKMSSMGDLFHALPAVRCLKSGLDAEVDWVVHAQYVDLVRCFTDVRRVIAFPRHAFLTHAPSFLHELRHESYDYVIDLQGLLKSAMVLRLARGGVRLGPSFSREGAHLFYDTVAGAQNKDRHAVDEVLDVVRFLKLPMKDPVFPARFPRQTLDTARPRVGLLPCSRRAEKNWPAEKFVEVARALLEDAGATVYLLGSTADRAVCEHIEAGLSGRVVNLCGRTNMVELGSLLQELDLVITVDSGPMHMAAAVGTPVLAVFGPTNPVRTGPYGAQHRVVRQGHVLADLPVQPVIEAAQSLLWESGATKMART